MNKKVLFCIFSGIIILLCSPLGLVFAQLHSYGPDIKFTDIIDNIITASWVIFGVIAVICFVIAGVLFLTAQGEPEKVKLARAAFIWGVVGVAVGIIAYSIISIVSSFIK